MHGLLLTGLLALIGCGLFGSDDGGGEDQPPETFFTAEANGEPWEGGGSRGFPWVGPGMATFTCQDIGLWLGIQGRTAIGHEDIFPYYEKISLHVLYEGPGTYSLVPNRIDEEHRFVSQSSYYEKGGDIARTHYYSTDDSSANQLTITRFDPEGSTEDGRMISRNSTALEEAGVMEGTFRTTVVIDSADVVPEPGEPPRLQPDTLRFTGGRFRVGVVEAMDAMEEAECGPIPEE